MALGTGMSSCPFMFPNKIESGSDASSRTPESAFGDLFFPSDLWIPVALLATHFQVLQIQRGTLALPAQPKNPATSFPFCSFQYLREQSEAEPPSPKPSVCACCCFPSLLRGREKSFLPQVPLSPQQDSRLSSLFSCGILPQLAPASCTFYYPNMAVALALA